MNPVNRKRWLPRIAFAVFCVGLGAVLSSGVLITWVETYPDAVDPKNIYYVLWKHGLNNNMNIDSALVAMSHDVWPVRQVHGLTREQLKNRFGYTRTLDEATPYLRGCYSTPGAAGQVETRGKRENVAFLRDSPWMVVIENEKAVDLILCKGY
jgi:hypothetical protein